MRTAAYQHRIALLLQQQGESAAIRCQRLGLTEHQGHGKGGRLEQVRSKLGRAFSSLHRPAKRGIQALKPGRKVGPTDVECNPPQTLLPIGTQVRNDLGCP
ncbi:hypothetical protein Nepgr_022374 [Nepenthes gracilis]|uniref:Uncharacterized protein n=1 Tax=Nepenthes gracilis TaxID=150966 RepID=A0AAD3XWX1_NEPGR|nr:hypothetical protein Nepgr_022374 [Nepenthes gracilis]